jgi:hypothetical protein
MEEQCFKDYEFRTLFVYYARKITAINTMKLTEKKLQYNRGWQYIEKIFLSYVFTTSLTTKLYKYHVVLDGSFGGKMCIRNNGPYKTWFLRFRMAVNQSEQCYEKLLCAQIFIIIQSFNSYPCTLSRVTVTFTHNTQPYITIFLYILLKKY